MIDKPCVVHDLDETAYHGDPVVGGSLSQSMAKLLLKPGGPARFRWQMDHPQPRRHEFEFGKAAHAKVLGVGSKVVVSEWSDFRTKAAREWRDEQQALGHVVLSADDAAKVDEMAVQIGRNKLAMSLLEDTEREVSLFAPDPTSGVWLRGRADAGSGVGFVDYKTAITADPERFSSACVTYGYHVQAVWYALLGDLTGSGYGDRFRFIVQEKSAPYLVSVCELDSTFEAKGRDDMRRAIDLYVECRDTNTWPGYAEEITLLAPPAWAFDDIDLELIGA